MKKLTNEELEILVAKADEKGLKVIEIMTNEELAAYKINCEEAIEMYENRIHIEECQITNNLNTGVIKALKKDIDYINKKLRGETTHNEDTDTLEGIQMEVEDIKVIGDYVVLNDYMAEQKDLVIEWTDYGDDYYNVGIVHKETGDLFGGLAWCGIYGLAKMNKIIRAIENKSGIKRVQKYVECE